MVRADPSWVRWPAGVPRAGSLPPATASASTTFAGPAAARPRAVIIFLHGIASHAGWFGETAAYLNSQGVAVYGPDRRGSGRGGGSVAHLERYGRALDDVEEMVRLVSSEHRAAPIFLAASSWAAKLAVVYAAQHRSLSGCCSSAWAPPRVNLSPTRRSSSSSATWCSDGSPAHRDAGGCTWPYVDFIREDRLHAGGDDPVLLGDGTSGPPALAPRPACSSHSSSSKARTTR